ncbi:MAG: N-acetylmuramoyl-L-alanine amidase, partial [Leptospiraceae bacterium]|nr:N-acetylmuramoyl-L-alanine amidase [Leptospiraceae bacterium]
MSDTPRKRPGSIYRPGNSGMAPSGAAPAGKTGADWWRRYTRRSFWIKAAIICSVALIGFLSLRYWWREMRWRWIVVHHSADDIGSMERYRRYHVEVKGWDDIAYHFVINNGSDGTSPGQIEVSDRWISRLHNASTRNAFVNQFGIAVVVVGNFELHGMHPLQKEALIQFLARLSQDYDIPPERIVGHREVQETVTVCPGKYVNMVELREQVAAQLQRSQNSSLDAEPDDSSMAAVVPKMPYAQWVNE